MVSGEFGEALLAYYLVKKGLHVIFARTVGFDLLVHDKKGTIFNKGTTLAISVKSRKSKSFSMNLEKDIEKLGKQCKIWGFKPYFGFVTPTEAIIFPMSVANIERVRTLSGRVSFPLLKQIVSSRIVDFEWGIIETKEMY